MKGWHYILLLFFFFLEKKRKTCEGTIDIELNQNLKRFYVNQRKVIRKNKLHSAKSSQSRLLRKLVSSLRGHARYSIYPDVAHLKIFLSITFSTHSPGANCEDDFSSGALDNLRCFLTGEEIVTLPDSDEDPVRYKFRRPIDNDEKKQSSQGNISKCSWLCW